MPKANKRSPENVTQIFFGDLFSFYHPATQVEKINECGLVIFLDTFAQKISKKKPTYR